MNRTIQQIRAKPLAIIIALAVILRLAVLLAFPSVFAFDQTNSVQGSDAYDAYANNLRTTAIYGRNTGVPDALIPPLYSYVLAGLYNTAGRGYIQVGLFHILLDVLSIVMLYLIGRAIMPQPFAESAALLAALFYAVYPYLIFQNLTLIDTPLFMALLYAFTWLMVVLRQQPNPATNAAQSLLIGVLGGVTFGLAILARPVILPLFPCIALWFLFRLDLRTTIIRLAVVTLAAVLTLAPWIYRNYMQYHAFVPVSVNSGMNFWFGNSKYTIPFLLAGYHPQWATPDEPVDPNDSRHASAQLMDISFKYLRENPGSIPELLWVKFLAYWSIDVFPRKNPVNGVVSLVPSDNGPVAVSPVPANDPVAAYSQPLFDRIGRSIHILYFGVLLLLALIGIVITAHSWRDVSLIWFMQISMTVVYVVFIPATRYRVPTDPALFLFSAWALLWLWYALQSRVIGRRLLSHTATVEQG